MPSEQSSQMLKQGSVVGIYGPTSNLNSQGRFTRSSFGRQQGHQPKHGFSPRAKSGMLLNNCCESFNNVLKDARTKPILSLMEWIRRYVMMRCCAKRQGLKNFEGTIMPSVVKMIERGQKEIYNMRLIQADLHVFEVQHGGDCFVVNLENKSRGCYRWTLMGIPCWHALACLSQRRLDYEDYVHQAYHVATYAKTYAPKFNAMPGQNQWEVTPYPQPLPPSYKIMPGRPSKRKRRKELGEGKKGKERRGREAVG
ncbi:uncharacterized protein [Spinacia oleracea]|uniref:SWIM-type domain-containing protein n=1 Tax=Spinacia oleracea TaxID=3562 RepID=A0ABM3RSB7_SPIOL|nr:uncharacterized protein LOC130472104 [Spinacia oleracea]